MTYSFAPPSGMPPSPYPMSPAPDPTAVMGRRIGAWVIDAILFAGLMIGLFSQLAVRDTQFGLTCEQLQDANVTSVCATLNDDVIFLDDNSDETILQLASLGWFVMVFVVLQGVTGGSIGKLATGIRVVDQHGKACGPVKSLVRSLLWIVDGAPWFLPGLVGFIVGLTSTGHRRVGDMVASTYVVAQSAVGTPITVGGATGIPNYAPSGPQSAYGSAWAPNPAEPVSTPPAPSEWAPQPAPAPAPTAPEAESWSSDVRGGLPEPVAPSEPAPAAPAGEPQWDAARNTYIQWDATAGTWLAWDDATKQWQPI